MKKINSTFLLLSLLSNIVLSQGNINNINIQPLNPSSNDTIFVYADIQFPSSSCEYFNSFQSTSANTIEITTQHCIGMLTTLCNITDTIKINPLSPGSYSLNLKLTSDINYGFAPCNGGTNVEDSAAVVFNVSAPLNFKDNKKINFSITPNPSNRNIYISSIYNINELSASIYSFDGKLILGEIIKLNTNLSFDLENGIYFLKLSNGNHTDIKKLIIKN